MTPTQRPPVPHPLRAFTEADLAPAAAQLVGDPAARATILARAVAENTCLLHAAYLVAWDNPPETRCSLCGERNEPRHRASDFALTPDHALCVARQQRGLPITPIPWTPEPCSCTPCSLARSAR